jgi:hypothetical protein
VRISAAVRRRHIWSSTREQEGLLIRCVHLESNHASFDVQTSPGRKLWTNPSAASSMNTVSTFLVFLARYVELNCLGAKQSDLRFLGCVRAREFFFPQYDRIQYVCVT